MVFVSSSRCLLDALLIARDTAAGLLVIQCDTSRPGTAARQPSKEAMNIFHLPSGNFSLTCRLTGSVKTSLMRLIPITAQYGTFPIGCKHLTIFGSTTEICFTLGINASRPLH